MRKRSTLALALVLSLALLLGACSSETPTGAAPASSEAGATSSIGTEGKTYNMGLMLPALDSPNWQKIAVAVQDAVNDYMAENSGTIVNLIVQGPAGEGEAEKYVSTLENLISSEKLDSLIVSSLFPDPVVPIVEQATNEGIWVNLYAFEISGSDENWKSLYLASSYDAGVYAAQAIYDNCVQNSRPLDGDIALFMSVVNTAAEDMWKGFNEKIQELMPDATLLDVQYNENDINKAIAQIEATYASHGDSIVGVFAGNNTTGTALSRVIAEGELAGKFAAVALDCDTEEVNALDAGNLDALVVRPDYDTCYQMGLDTIESMVNGTEFDKRIYCEYVNVTKENLRIEARVQKDLFPDS